MSKDLSPLQVKEVWVGDRRYIVCRNEEHATKDRADREAILETLSERLHQGATSLVGNRGYRRYLSAQGKGFILDEEKIERNRRFDGKWVLRTTTDLEPAEVALAYKQLWMVEDIFRSMKSLLETRPIYHRTDEAIRGHVFCSFLALRLRAELESRLATRAVSLEWSSILRDLDRLKEVEREKQSTRFILRTEVQGVAGKVFQATGVTLPPALRQGSRSTRERPAEQGILVPGPKGTPVSDVESIICSIVTLKKRLTWLLRNGVCGNFSMSRRRAVADMSAGGEP